MAAQFTDELQAEAPPSKRVRLEYFEDIQGTTMGMMEDTYHAAANESVVKSPKTSQIEIQKMATAESSALNMKGIPGLGLLGQTPVLEQRSTLGGEQYGNSSSKFTKLIKSPLQMVKQTELPLI